ncbi:hypothetical protein H0G86_004921 [Trichoderma simmonsii]|uniref:NACHT domain-containing protein n=1 Tax=Trichoderma simmonsii TaxID=1491479 RepID=A0A8G0LDI8_9HYPO|nr:hypothetical protein H0G86_004921 [Trichoderma simmonsii]
MMVDVSSEGFTRSLDKFKRSLTDEQKRNFSSCNITEVKSQMQEIQDKIGPVKKLRNFTRLKKFLEGMKQIEDLVTIFLNVSEVVAFVWGPIKLALMVATTRVDTLERLLEVYHELGEVLHGVGKYDRLFKNHPDAREILETYFYSILEFHHAVLEVFARPGWKRLFDYAWPTFKTRFNPIIDNLKRHRALLSDEKLTVVIEEIQESRDVAKITQQQLFSDIKKQLDEIKQSLKEKDIEHRDCVLREKYFLVSKLEPPEYDADQHRAYSQRDVPSSGDWILEDPRFKNWVNGNTRTESVLYLNGMPGSGKTTLVSLIVEYMLSHRKNLNGIVTFFYFGRRSQNGINKTANSMLRGLLAQILDQDDTLRECIYQKCAGLNKFAIHPELFLQELVEECLSGQQRVWIILDGLDDCEGVSEVDRTESRRVLEWFQSKILSRNMSQNGSVRLLISGQRDGHIDQMLFQHPGINLDATDPHIKDIETFTRSKAVLIRTRFSLDPLAESQIVEKVTAVSKGMFLFSKVVLGNFLSQDSVAELEDELMQDNFPQILDEAYDRIAIRVFNRSSPSRRRSTEQILSWIICSARKLRWREIQSRFCISPEEGACNFKKKRVDTCKVLCSSFVEVEPCSDYGDTPSEQIISLVHETAGSYLAHTGRVRILEEHARTAIFCSQYLTSLPFTSELNTLKIQELALTGFYGFLDYAVAFWHHHFKRAMNSESGANSDLRAEALQSAKRVHDIWVSSLPQDQEIGNLIPEQPAQSDIKQQYQSAGDIHGIHQRIISIRKGIEAINLSSLAESHRTSFIELDGITKFKCPDLRCTKFSDGFCDEHHRDLHVRAHKRPFKCVVDGCYARVMGYPTSQALDAHSKRFHDEDSGTTLSFPKQSGTEVSAMHAAARQGNLALVMALHTAGIPLNSPIKPRGGLTPMVLAARNGHANICEYLMRQGVDGCNTALATMISPAAEAVKRDDIELFQCLWHKRKEAFNIYDVRPLVISILRQGSQVHLEELLKDLKPEQVRANLPTILTSASKISVVNLAQRKMTLYQTQRRLLHSIVGRAFPTLYEADGCTLKYGIRVSDSELFSICAHEILASRNAIASQVLQDACLFRSYGCIEFLLDFTGPTDLRAQDSRGATPLHNLIKYGHDSDGFTRACFLSVFKRLIQGDIMAANMQDNAGDLPLHNCCDRNRNKDIFPLLLPLTSNLNQQNRAGETPLEVAVNYELDEQVISLLQSRRVDLNMRTNFGDTLSLLIVRRCTNQTIRGLLRELNNGSLLV